MQFHVGLPIIFDCNLKSGEFVMKEKLTPHIRSLISSGSESVKRQFFIDDSISKDYEVIPIFTESDPLLEDSHEVVKGLIHKYANRILWKVTYKCAAHCQFCTRIRQIGSSEDDLSSDDLQRGFEYLSEHNEVTEVILSGGDPLFAPYVAKDILKGLLGIPSIKSIRIGTRLPIHQPSAFKKKPLRELLDLIGGFAFERPLYMLINVDHPDELTSEVLDVFCEMRKKELYFFRKQSF